MARNPKGFLAEAPRHQLIRRRPVTHGFSRCTTGTGVGIGTDVRGRWVAAAGGGEASSPLIPPARSRGAVGGVGFATAVHGGRTAARVLLPRRLPSGEAGGLGSVAQWASEGKGSVKARVTDCGGCVNIIAPQRLLWPGTTVAGRLDQTVNAT